jgi:hypothetical protein
MAAHVDGGKIMWWRIALGMLAGIVSGAVLAGVIEFAGHLVFPPPAGVDFTDPAQTVAMDLLPMGAKIGVIVAWAIGSLVGGMIAAWIGRAQIAAFGVGGILLGLGIWTMMLIPHPMWMLVAGCIALFVPAVLGGYLVMKRTPTAAAAA